MIFTFFGFYRRVFPYSDGDPPYLCIKKVDRGGRPLRMERARKRFVEPAGEDASSNSKDSGGSRILIKVVMSELGEVAI
jgi:hypothetical protein